jgi:hypothetical protein
VMSGNGSNNCPVEIEEGSGFRARPTVHPYGISLNQLIAEVGLTHEPCPLRQNHVIIHSEWGLLQPLKWPQRLKWPNR